MLHGLGKAVAAALALSAGLGGFFFLTTRGDAIVALPAYNVAPATVSVSGLSSGGYMAAQMHFAYSATIAQGAGIIAAGPVYCSQGKLDVALGPCMADTGSRNLPRLQSVIDDWAAKGLIDPLSNMRDDKVYLFSGTNDSTVRQSVMDDLKRMVEKVVPASHITYRNTVAAEHGMPTDDYGNACGDKGSPFINDCDVDVAGNLLEWIIGPLKAKNTGTLGGSFLRFDQKPFWGNRNPTDHGMANDGWAYVPAECAAGGSCRLHVAFHGCKQSAATIGDKFYRHAGYNEWADTNAIIILYPQAKATLSNPNGCWDWWGYDDANFAMKSGAQMVAIKTMIDRIVSGNTAAPYRCQDWYASNQAHVRNGRAYASGNNAYATTSNQYLGFHSAAAYTNVRSTSPGYYAYGTCS